MRVVFISHSSSLDGAPRSLLNLLDGLIPRGIAPLVIVPEKGYLVEEIEKRGIPVEIIPYQKWIFRHSEKPDFSWLVKRAGELLKTISVISKWKARLVYTNSSVIGIGALAAFLTCKKHIWHLRECFSEIYPCSKLKEDFYRKFILKTGSHIAISRYVKNYLTKGQRELSVDVIPNGIAFEKDVRHFMNPEQASFSQGKPFIFLIAGSVYSFKNQMTGIEAFSKIHSRYPDAELWIAGEADEQYLSACRQQGLKLGAGSKIKFLGYQRNIYPDMFLQCGAIVSCSERESLGRTILEAMSVAKPVIAYRGGGIPEIVRHEETGLLYDSGPEELSVCMERFLTHEQETRMMGERGRQVFLKNYTLDMCAEKVYEIIKQTAG